MVNEKRMNELEDRLAKLEAEARRESTRLDRRIDQLLGRIEDCEAEQNNDG